MAAGIAAFIDLIAYQSSLAEESLAIAKGGVVKP